MDHRRLVSLAALLHGCSTGQPPDLPSFELPPEPVVPAPTLAEVLRDQAPIAEAAIVVAADGAELVLSDGLAVHVPPGALPVGATLRAARFATDAFDGAPVQHLYAIDATEPLSLPVTIDFPVPRATEPGVDVEVVRVDDDDDPTRIEASLSADGRTASVRTDRLSTWSVERLLWETEVPGGDVLLEVPLYVQGNTGYCWSISLLMLLRAYGADPEPWDNTRFFQLPSEEGMSFFAFAHEEPIVEYIHRWLPGVNVIRKTWWTTTSQSGLRRHLINNVRQARPTMLFLHQVDGEAPRVDGSVAPEVDAGTPLTPTSHMVLVVGFEAPDTFVVHDPAGQGYRRLPWAEVERRLEAPWGFDGTATLALERPMPGEVPTVTVSLPHQGLSLAAQVDGRWAGGPRRTFVWYSTQLRREGILDVATGRPAALTSGMSVMTADLSIGNGSNRVRELRAGFDLLRGGAVVYRHPGVSLTLGPGQTREVSLYDRYVPLSELVTAGGDHELVGWVEAEGTRQDETHYRFTAPGPNGLQSVAYDAVTAAFVNTCDREAGLTCQCIGTPFCESSKAAGVTCSDALARCQGVCILASDEACDCWRYCPLWLAAGGCSVPGG